MRVYDDSDTQLDCHDSGKKLTGYQTECSVQSDIRYSCGILKVNHTILWLIELDSS